MTLIKENRKRKKKRVLLCGKRPGNAVGGGYVKKKHRELNIYLLHNNDHKTDIIDKNYKRKKHTLGHRVHSILPYYIIQKRKSCR